MQRRIDGLLLTPLTPSSSIKWPLRVVMDGTFLDGRSSSAFVVLDAKTRHAITWDYGAKENQHDLVRLFERMHVEGHGLISATIDGHPAIARALLHVWPDIKIQRCLVHIQRQGLMWCRVNPKRAEAKTLRELFLNILYVNTRDKAQEFFHRLDAWELKHGARLDKELSRGWVLSDLKRARSMLLKARPFLFQYLDDPQIPKTTNIAEGFFSRFKGLLRDHRGMSDLHRQQAFEWFCMTRN